MFPTDMERFTAGHQQGEVRASSKKIRRHRGRGDYLLEVVENQQHPARRQMQTDGLQHWLVARVADSQSLRDGSGDEDRITNRR